MPCVNCKNIRRYRQLSTITHEWESRSLCVKFRRREKCPKVIGRCGFLRHRWKYFFFGVWKPSDFPLKSSVNSENSNSESQPRRFSVIKSKYIERKFSEELKPARIPFDLIALSKPWTAAQTHTQRRAAQDDWRKYLSTFEEKKTCFVYTLIHLAGYFEQVGSLLFSRFVVISFHPEREREIFLWVRVLSARGWKKFRLCSRSTVVASRERDKGILTLDS